LLAPKTQGSVVARINRIAAHWALFHGVLVSPMLQLCWCMSAA
jgi:hypothetical protein